MSFNIHIELRNNRPLPILFGTGKHKLCSYAQIYVWWNIGKKSLHCPFQITYTVVFQISETMSEFLPLNHSIHYPLSYVMIHNKVGCVRNNPKSSPLRGKYMVCWNSYAKTLTLFFMLLSSVAIIWSFKWYFFLKFHDYIHNLAKTELFLYVIKYSILIFGYRWSYKLAGNVDNLNTTR